jgi:hypothetical protein
MGILSLIISMGLFFILIGFLITPKNASFLLSGYNSLTEKERLNFDLENYLRFFKSFHVALGISFIFFGLIIYNWFDSLVIGIFLAVYPILGYIYFLIKSSKFSRNATSKNNKIGVYVLGFSLFFVLGFLIYELKDNKMVINNHQIEISGSYGESIIYDSIKQISIVKKYPNITFKINGTSIGKVKKGFFKTINQEVVKLILNSDSDEILYIEKKNGEKIYFSSKNQNIKELMNLINQKKSNFNN